MAGAVELAGEIHKSEGQSEKLAAKGKGTEEVERRLEGKRDELDAILKVIEPADDDSRDPDQFMKGVREWIRDRLRAVFGAGTKIPDDEMEEMVKRILVEMGLETAEELFIQGKAYRPSRNRHRSEMLRELRSLMEIACGDFDSHQEAFKTSIKRAIGARWWEGRKNILDRVRENWKTDIRKVEERANDVAQRAAANGSGLQTAEAVKKRWIEDAEKILNREYRKKRFSNRKIGECQVECEGEKRCGKNPPRKAKPEVRKLQFEIEARQTDTVQDNQRRSLTDGEVKAILNSVKFERKPSTATVSENRRVIRAHPAIKGIPPGRADEDDEDTRGRLDALIDIATGGQNGRTSFCMKHLEEKRKLLVEKNTLKDNYPADEWEVTGEGEDWRNRWNALGKERVLDLALAPPSIRQKVELVLHEIDKVMKRSEVKQSQVSHVGLETARFDISALAQNEGKKMTKKSYQKSRRPGRGDAGPLAEGQGRLCFFCGRVISLSDVVEVDHLFPQKGRMSSNKQFNLVAVHSLCNALKGKTIHNQDRYKLALERLRLNDPEKADFIQKRLAGNHQKMWGEGLEAEQHTMYGAKLLKNALVSVLGISDEVVKKVRPRDVSLLLEHWYPEMYAKKRALRLKYKDEYAWFADAGDEKTIDLSKKLYSVGKKLDSVGKKLYKTLFAGKAVKIFIHGKPPKKIPDWMVLEGKTLKIAPQKGDEGVYTVCVTLQEADDKVLIQTTNQANKTSESETRIKEEIKISVTKFMDRKSFKSMEVKNGADTAWLEVQGSNLVGTVENFAKRDGNVPYVPWQTIIIHDTYGRKIRTVVKAFTAYKKIDVGVSPTKDDTFNQFHHILDATVMAANVDWDAIGRLATNPNERRSHSQKHLMGREIQKGRPDLNGWDSAKLSGFVKRVSQSKTGSGKSKYDTQALRVRDGEITQRKPLDQIKEKMINRIVDPNIREALRSALNDIDERDKETRSRFTAGSGSERTITQDYFLSLDHKNILNPRNTRSARCKELVGIGEIASIEQPSKRWRHKKGQGGKHHLKRSNQWDEVVVWRGPDGKKGVSRKRESFYMKESGICQYEHPIPEDAEIIERFHKGDYVRIRGKEASGVWKVKMMSKGKENLENIDTRKIRSAQFTGLYKESVKKFWGNSPDIKSRKTHFS